MNSPAAIPTLMEVCRTCMGENESYFNCQPRLRRHTPDLISIFNEPQSSTTTLGVTIMDLLQLTVPRLTIAADDFLPKKVCSYCVDNLVTIQEFQQMCIRVEQRFQELINGHQETTEVNVTDPLNSNTMDQAFNDLSNVLKIEMDDTVADDIAYAAQKDERIKVVEVCKTGNDSVTGEQDETDSCNDGNDLDDSDSEWEPDADNNTRKRKCESPDKTAKPHLEVYNKSDDSREFPIPEICKPEDFDDKKPFACDECGNRLKTSKSLKRHQLMHLRQSNEKEHKCKHCNRVFQKLSSLRNHLKSHRDNYCDADINDHSESSNEDDDLEDADGEHHNKTETNEGEITQASNEVEKQKDDFQQKPYVCGQCGSRLKTRKSLKRHLRIHLRQPGERGQIKAKYECEHCKKVFQQSSSLKDHLRVHTGEQPYLCSECGKAFKSLSNMKQHFLRHGTDRPYECPDCPKKFPCLSDLASHKAVHSKQKSHVCDVCGAGFFKPYLLKKHKMYHNGEKNHKCDYCEMRFVLADQCRRHMRTHTGEKPYKCKYCVRAFAQSNDLIKHLRGHLGDNVYKCDMCPQGFRLQGDLRTHFNTHKNDDDETRLRNLQALKDDELRIQMKFGLVQASKEH